MNKQRTIIVEDYNPAWADWFLQIKEYIQAILEPLAVPIEHVGSTSVPELAAKPIIDIDIVLPEASMLAEIIHKLDALGYTYEGDLGISGREAFRQPSNGLPPHHLYACMHDADALADHLDLRNYLRSHPEAAIEYGELKKQLAAQYPHDINAYLDGKAPFIKQHLAKARKHLDEPCDNIQILEFLSDITEVSTACGTTSYIWGGLTVDLYQGRFLRKHHDIDAFTLNLLDVRDEMMRLYQLRGYTTKFIERFDMMVIRRGGLHAAFNRLEVVGQLAMWRHIGNEGTVYFPTSWLDQRPRVFKGVSVYSAGIKLDYVFKTKIRMFNAQWCLREQDHMAIQQLEDIMQSEHIIPEQFLQQIWSYNPFWVKLGYPEYASPMLPYTTS